jgi:hypothetical protein
MFFLTWFVNIKFLDVHQEFISKKMKNNILAVSQSAFPYKMTDTNFQLEGVVHRDP